MKFLEARRRFGASRASPALDMKHKHLEHAGARYLQRRSPVDYSAERHRQLGIERGRDNTRWAMIVPALSGPGIWIDPADIVALTGESYIACASHKTVQDFLFGCCFDGLLGFEC